MTLDKSINLSGPGFFHLQSAGVGRDDAWGTFRGATRRLRVTSLPWFLSPVLGYTRHPF